MWLISPKPLIYDGEANWLRRGVLSQKYNKNSRQNVLILHIQNLKLSPNLIEMLGV